MTDDYLWDRTGSIDRDVERLETTLATLRYRGDAPVPPAAMLGRARTWLGVAAVLAVGIGIGWMVLRTTLAPPIEVQTVTGTATIDGRPALDGQRLDTGSWLTTGTNAKVRVRIADIGHVTVYADTRLGLQETKAGLVHRLRLDHGTIDALITAPPRLFVVSTPSALAVDLGCAYRLEVDASGEGLISVALGSVALEGDGYVATVPEGARCRLYANRGPGIPWFTDAPDALKRAIEPLSVTEILDHARPRDVLTLWHLLWHVDAARRSEVIDRMIDLVGIPPGLDPDRARQLDRDALQAWWDDIELDW